MANFSNRVESIASTFGTDTIFILGKGPSVDRINPALLSNALVIGLNDAERIAPCDITIFHDGWVHEALKASGWRSRLYVTPQDIAPPRGDVAHARHVRGDQEGTDVMMSRLVTDTPGEDFVIEDVLFVSALRLARLIARQRGRTQTVYMLGFDFAATKGYAHAIDHDYAPTETGERMARISPQEFYFINTLYMLRDSEVDIQHVGDRAFSGLTPEELNTRFLPELDSGTDTDPDRVLVTAELTTNHFGDRNRLERMVRAARAAGADFVKVQKRDVESFYPKEQLDGKYVSPFGTTFRDYRHALELSQEDFEFLDRLCRDLGIRWFASVLDEPSFRFMQQFEPELVKLPSTISEHTDYLAHVANTYKGGIVLSTGMTDTAYEQWVLETFTSCDRLYLMQCNSAYPTPLHDCDIGVIRHYRDLSKAHPHIVPAYSSHDFGALASTLAVAAGARMVEKHVKLGNTEWAHFDAVALDLTTREFADYVAAIREAEVIIGSEEKRVNESEHHKYFRKAG
ncbi:N-acetylneuraminate synthase family protein [Rhodobacteraceae bacterium 2376]|uniref:N-acetylneuraminate synthase family protein n=1 Tax=Rhabdonatronobacter sediminivivens TaxID=2743469 RepID=A0A7Z0I2B1_9RHOB|nr:N-acetylneuraminate synthase family protein [Rhabdonatronobacter sediminivivens]NYS26219.1 N-acetylneuraminate synthase family protein [Rhabdonatronobacter sediminivivens]